MSKPSPRRRPSSRAPTVDLGAAPSSHQPHSLRSPPRSTHSPGSAAEAFGRARVAASQSLVVARNDGELILDFPRSLEPTTAIRSTLITSSLSSLRARGLFERYDALMTSPHRQTILNAVAGEWFPLEVGAAHYHACDALGLSAELQFEIGRDVSRRLHDTFLNLIVKAARGVGLTPWTLLPKGNSMQSRLYVGGGVRVFKLGPKAARVELARIPLLAIPYVRNGVVGVYAAGIELLADNVTARIVKTESFDPAQLVVLRIDWD
jgi:hypothetical protein